ncbi:MAG: hypothetical protein KUL75_00370 [Sterolibacterium sp.]|nr:hypothetical protein [Sterolibacterium sp.]
MSRAEQELLAAGWQRQTTMDEPRLSELAETYRSLGYAVHIERDAVTDGCGECYQQRQGCTLGTLYIRPDEQAGPGGDEDEWF